MKRLHLLQSHSGKVGQLVFTTLAGLHFLWGLDLQAQVLSPSSATTFQMRAFPQGPEGESLRRAERLLTNTPVELPQHVGNKLSCTNCHLNLGRKFEALPWIGVDYRYPQYRARSGKIDNLTERVNDCFERSLNGKALPEGSQAMQDILALMKWLSPPGTQKYSKGFPENAPLKLKRKPNLKRGERIYAEKCSACHQPQGLGLELEQRVFFPAVWGENSFNIAAGMARLHTATRFIKNNMPQGQEGSLSQEDAWDVAGFLTQQKRPDFVNKKRDWPKGGKPDDARY